MNGHNFPGGQGDAGAVGQGGGVLNLDGMRLSINYFPNISLASRFFLFNKYQVKSTESGFDLGSGRSR